MAEIVITVDKNEIIRNELIKKATEIYNNAMGAAMPKIISKADLIVKTAIDAYYDSYSPFVYQRTESLYSVFRIQRTKNGFNLLFSEKKLGGHRVDGKYIYDVMFKKGYHGGAPYNGDYYWRWPSPGSIHEQGYLSIPYVMWYPYGPAIQTESPWERIQSEWNEYANGEGKQLLLNAFRSEINKVIKEVL